jgi:hypothetical protein
VLGRWQHGFPGRTAAGDLVSLAASSFSRALCVLAEALVSGKRVIVVGDSSLGLHDVLSDLDARIVHVFDPAPDRPLEQTPPTQRGVVLRAMPEGDFDVRDGAYDLAVVPDLSAVSDAAALLSRLRRVVGTDGAVLCAATNADADEGAGSSGIGYYELYDVVSLQFSNVRMIAAMPMHGVTLAELGQDEIDAAVRVDTQLAGDRSAPDAFVALASQHEMALDAYTIIELPAPRVERIGHDGTAMVELAQVRLRAEVLEGQVGELTTVRAAHARAEESVRRALADLEVERDRVRRLEHDLDKTQTQKQKREEDTNRHDDLPEQLAQAQIRMAALEEGVELAEKTIVVQRERISEVEALLAERADLAPPEAEVAELEGKLKERGAVIAALEAELGRRDRLVRELVARFEGASQDDDLTRKLDDLARLAARQKSELEAQAWRITELQRS